MSINTLTEAHKMPRFKVTYTFTGEYQDEVEAAKEEEAEASVRAAMLEAPGIVEGNVLGIFECDDDNLEAEEI